jgi:hypothetical protein
MKTLRQSAKLLAIVPVVVFAQGVHPEMRQVPSQPSTSGGTPVTAASPLMAPVLGFITGEAPSGVRAIVGTPSSASLTADIFLSSSVTRVSEPPRQAYVLAETATPEGVAVVSFSGLSPGTPALITDALPGADLVSFSPSGSAALLYFASTQRLQVISGLPAQPVLAADVIVSGSPTPFRTMAVSDDASVFLGATAESVFVVATSGSAEPIYTSAKLGSVALIPQTSDAAVLDLASGSLIRLRGLTGAVTDEIIASGLGFSPEASLQVTSDAHSVLVADPDASAVVAFDLATHAATTFATAHPPRGLTPLRAANVFLLSADPDTAAWILNVTQAGASNYFVAQQSRQLVRVTESSSSQASSAHLETSAVSQRNTVQAKGSVDAGRAAKAQ